MFNLERSISDWRKQMLNAGIKSPAPLEELEGHLREEIGSEVHMGILEQFAFETAVGQIGQAQRLRKEFEKLRVETWSRPLAWAAWILFTVSFFLPTHQWGGRGWECSLMVAKAWASPGFWQEFWRTKNEVFSEDFLLALMTLANVLMISSPLLILRFANNVRFSRWFCISTFIALILAWSYIVLWLGGGSRSLKIGCYVWGISFLPLCLCALKTFLCKKMTTAS